MPNAYVVGSKDVEAYIKLPGIPAIRIETGTTLSINIARTVQDIYAISFPDPIDTLPINAQYTLTLGFQTAEYYLLLNAVNGSLPAGQAPYAALSQIPSMTISKTTYMRNAAVPHTATESFVNCVVESISSEVNRNDAETLTTITLRATNLMTTVSPITGISL